MEKYKGKILHRGIKDVYIDRKNEKVIIKMKNGETKQRNLKTGVTSNHTYFMYEGHEYLVDVATGFNKDLLIY
jgi:hypothetical protein